MWKMRIVSGLLATILSVAHSAAQPPSGALPASPGDDALVLVVPFTNLAGDPADDWIGVGIAEAVAIDLQVTGTPVLRATAEARGDSGSGGVLEVGRRAGAGRVVSGAYQRSGDLIRVTARVLDVAGGTVLRSATVTGLLRTSSICRIGWRPSCATKRGPSSHGRRRRRRRGWSGPGAAAAATRSDAPAAGAAPGAAPGRRGPFGRPAPPARRRRPARASRRAVGAARDSRGACGQRKPPPRPLPAPPADPSSGPPASSSMRASSTGRPRRWRRR